VVVVVVVVVVHLLVSPCSCGAVKSLLLLLQLVLVAGGLHQEPLLEDDGLMGGASKNPQNGNTDEQSELQSVNLIPRSNNKSTLALMTPGAVC
jgi:hypothetical protein